MVKLLSIYIDSEYYGKALAKEILQNLIKIIAFGLKYRVRAKLLLLAL